MGYYEDRQRERERYMRYSELRAEARLRELSIIRVGGHSYTLSKSRTGEVLGKFKPQEDDDALLAKIQEFPIVEVVVPQSVGWNAVVPPSAPVLQGCPNGYGAECFCQDKTETEQGRPMWWLCALGPCPAKARCRGVCVFHLGYVLGQDYTEQSIKKTEFAMGQGYDPSSPPMSTKFAPLKNIAPTSRARQTLTVAEIQQIADGAPGVIVRHIPEQNKYQVLNKDGKIIDEVENREDLFWSDDED